MPLSPLEAENEQRVLVFSLFGGDAALTRDILGSADIATHVCEDIDSLSNAIAEGAAAVIVTEEALVPHVAERLVQTLEGQPTWSDLPLIVSVTERQYATSFALGARVNVVGLERPVSVRALIGTVESALRARRRQYETRDLLHSLELFTRRTERLQGLAAAFSAARTTSDVAEVALTQGSEAAGAPRGLLGVLAQDDTVLDVILMRGFSAETVNMWRTIPMSTSAPLTDAVRRATPAFYERPEDIAFVFPQLAAARSPKGSALAVLPLTIGSRTFGAMGLIYDEPRSFDEADRTQMFAIARLCAQAMDRAFLFELAQRERLRAEDASRTKDEFLAMVSHELRTPLNAMLGWTQMLRTGDLDPARRKKALETIERNALAQTQLIEDLLDVTRIITGKLGLTIGQVDLVRVIEAAVETVRPAAVAKGVHVQTDLEQLSGPLAGDVDRLQQVVWNLLSNAVKFTPAGGHVHVQLRMKGPSAEIVVNDTGSGIPPEFLPHIFERFRQADGGTTRSYGGLGLGLTIVKHLVELHGGTIDARSDGRGRGSSFVLRIPIAPARSRPLPPIRPLAQGPSRPPVAQAACPQIAGLRVLVVEDEADARDLLVVLLEECKVAVRAVGTAAEGLEALSKWQPDVIVSDIGMPIEDGYTFIQRVRALPRERGGAVPAVALTAYARMEDRRRALLAGFNMHVSKPIDREELFLVLANLAGRSEPQADRTQL
jgi:signal transduction histidine kinase/ActR/RegA family two-component response regulator